MPQDCGGRAVDSFSRAAGSLPPPRRPAGLLRAADGPGTATGARRGVASHRLPKQPHGPGVGGCHRWFCWRILPRRMGWRERHTLLVGRLLNPPLAKARRTWSPAAKSFGAGVRILQNRSGLACVFNTSLRPQWILGFTILTSALCRWRPAGRQGLSSPVIACHRPCDHPCHRPCYRLSSPLSSGCALSPHTPQPVGRPALGDSRGDGTHQDTLAKRVRPLDGGPNGSTLMRPAERWRSIDSASARLPQDCGGRAVDSFSRATGVEGRGGARRGGLLTGRLPIASE
jgi:hypothetical protein